MQLNVLIIVFLPVFTPLAGQSLAAVLAQDKWPAWANDLVAWTVLLAISGVDMWANGQFAGGWLAIIGDAVQTVTLLASGWLAKLDPWLAWLNWLQSNVFNLVPLLGGQTVKAIPVQASAQTITTQAFQPPKAITLPTLPQKPGGTTP